MNTLPYPMIACVGYPTHEMFEYLKHNNTDPRVYDILDIWNDSNESAKKYRPMMHDYMQRDMNLRMTTKLALDRHQENYTALAEEITDPDAVKELFRSFHNFYFDYIESIKYILDDANVLIPYPLTSNKTIEFDHYIILEQSEQGVREEFGSSPALLLEFDMIKDRIAEVTQWIPQEKSTRVVVPYAPYDRSREVSAPMELISHIVGICGKCVDDHHRKLSESMDSNPQSSNSTS